MIEQLLASIRPQDPRVLGGAPSPTFPAAAPQMAPQGPSQPAGGLPANSKLTQLIPIIAAFIAAKQGGLPGFAQGMTNANQQRQAQQTQQQEMQMRQQAQAAEAERWAAQTSRQEAEFQWRQQQAQAEQQARAEEAERKRKAENAEYVWEWYERVKDNPEFIEQIHNRTADDPTGPAAFDIGGPNGVNINMLEALKTIFPMGPKPDGKYPFPLAKPITPPPAEPIVATEAGFLPRSQAIGKMPYRAPSQAAPKEPVAHYRGADGKPHTVTRSAVTAVLKQEAARLGVQFETADVDAAMADPDWLAELFPGTAPDELDEVMRSIPSEP